MAFSSEDAARLIAQGRRDAAISTARAAANCNDPAALLQLAIWLLVGRHLPRDLIAARQFLRRASEAGSVDASHMEIALAANGSGAARDWSGAVALLRAVAATDPVAADQLQLVEQMALGREGMPLRIPTPERLCESPEILRYSSFISPDECRHLAQSAEDLLAPAQVMDPATNRLIEHPIRTSDFAVIGPTREDLVIQAILRRIAVASDTAVEQGEPLNILRYAVGQQYRLHSDALPNVVNQRTKTAILYLNDNFKGGGTLFPDAEVQVAPVAGDLLLFTNTLPNGRPDPVARHAGLPVVQGTKWIATRWIRANPFDVWNPS